METAWHHGGGSLMTGAFSACMKEKDLVNNHNTQLTQMIQTLNDSFRKATKELHVYKLKNRVFEEENAQMKEERRTLHNRLTAAQEQIRVLEEQCLHHEGQSEQFRMEARRSKFDIIEVEQLRRDSDYLRERVRHVEEQLEGKYVRVFEDLA